MSRKNRWKKAECLNCGYRFEKANNFCPSCGQKNQNRLIPIKELLLEFLGDFFTFDSKLFRSLKPLLFKPGALSQAFNNGKRIAYIPPVRIFVFSSIIYFFLVSLSNDANDHQGVLNLDFGEPIVTADSGVVNFHSSIIQDSVAVDSIDTTETSVNLFNNRLSPEQIELLRQGQLDQIMDSLEFDSSINRRIARQVLKLYALSQEQIVEKFYSWISIMLYFLIPIFGLFLKLLYFRHDRYLIEHLVFSLHFHSFFIIVASLTTLITLITGLTNLLGIAVLISIVYLFFALHKVYGGSRGKDMLKSSLLLLGYGIFVLPIGFLITAALTFLTL